MKKHSRKRDAILAKLRSTDTHPSAEWVYTNLKPEFPDLSLATVYRNISEFLREGLIISVGVVNGQERYDGNVLPHPHFFCDGCGSVIDVGDSLPDGDLDKLVSEKYGVKIARHEICFHGTCTKCS